MTTKEYIKTGKMASRITFLSTALAALFIFLGFLFNSPAFSRVIFICYYILSVLAIIFNAILAYKSLSKSDTENDRENKKSLNHNCVYLLLSSVIPIIYVFFGFYLFMFIVTGYHG